MSGRSLRGPWTVAAVGVAAAAILGVLAARPGVVQAQPRLAEAALADAQSRIPKDADVDLQRGLDVVMGRADCSGQGQCSACYQCHQIRGQGSVTAEFPRLAGQSYRYLYATLEDFASGRRSSPTMTPIARALGPKEMRDVAAFYSAQEPRTEATAAYAAQQSNAPASVLASGGQLAAIGSPERGVQACQNCHGPQGAGLPPTYPYLAGQYAAYTEAQLEAWQTGERTAGGAGFDLMADIAKRLTRQQINAVAQYYASIQPPRMLRDENYTGVLDIGVPLTPDPEERGQSPAPTAGSNGAGQGAPLQAEPPEQKLAVPPNRIP
jgi:cytochrome c553